MPLPPAPRRGLTSQRAGVVIGDVRPYPGDRKARLTQDSADGFRPADTAQHLGGVAPQRPALTQTLDQARPVFETAGIDPWSLWCLLQGSAEPMRIPAGQPLHGTACLQIGVGEEVDAPWLQSGAQGGERGGAGAGPEDDQRAHFLPPMRSRAWPAARRTSGRLSFRAARKAGAADFAASPTSPST